MDEQPGLFDDLDADEATLQGRFLLFHEEHPDVYLLFLNYAEELHRAGVEHYGAKGIFERIRWHYATSSQGQTFKINNSFTSRYVRMLERDRPDLAAMFEKRELKSA